MAFGSLLFTLSIICSFKPILGIMMSKSGFCGLIAIVFFVEKIACSSVTFELPFVVSMTYLLPVRTKIRYSISYFRNGPNEAIRKRIDPRIMELKKLLTIILLVFLVIAVRLCPWQDSNLRPPR